MFFKHAFVLYFRTQSRRSSKRIALSKHVSELATAASSASECETDCNENGNQRQKVKLTVTRGKSLNTTHRRKPKKEHRSSKTTLVTLRTSQEEEEEEEADDFEHDDEEECFTPEEINKAPVFVPIGLQSPKPVPVEIEETMEEVSCSWVFHMYFCFDCLNNFYSKFLLQLLGFYPSLV